MRTRFPETEVVLLTMQESPRFAKPAIDAGAIGFVVKDRADAELLAAARTRRTRIHSKLAFRTRAELVQFALRRHLIGT